MIDELLWKEWAYLNECGRKKMSFENGFEKLIKNILLEFTNVKLEEKNEK